MIEAESLRECTKDDPVPDCDGPRSQALACEQHRDNNVNMSVNLSGSAASPKTDCPRNGRKPPNQISFKRSRFDVP
jgi:hypothetical protein